jgi:radical SAM protein with 4Fe4S-binding SPASM domain
MDMAGIHPTKRPVEPDTPFIAPPQYLQVFTTFRCNRACSFCFNGGIDRSGEIAIDDFSALTGAMRGSGIREIDVLGGEPTMHTGFFRMLDILKESGLRANLSTNGSNVRVLKGVAESRSGGNLLMGISVNSDPIPEELHGFIETFRPRVKSVCSRRHALPMAARRYLGARGIECRLLYMDAVTEESLEDTLTFCEYMEILNGLKRTYGNLEGVHCGFLMDAGLRHVRCPAGTTKLSVLPDGSVYPCYLFFRHREFRLGNILEDGFESIWQSPVLDFFRKFRSNACTNKGCRLNESCHGGCPAISLLLAGDVEAPDPRCVRG